VCNIRFHTPVCTVHIVQLAPYPDDLSCPGGLISCLLSKGEYGCCLGADSILCPLRGYCCLQGYKRGPDDNCVPDNTTRPAIKKINVPGTKIHSLTKPVTYHPCPHGASCTDDQTCCEVWGHISVCCPVKDAVCCPDGATCCPNGYTCDTKLKECLKKHNQTTVPLRRLLLRSSLGLVEDRHDDHSCQHLVNHTCGLMSEACGLRSELLTCCSYENRRIVSSRSHSCILFSACQTTHQNFELFDIWRLTLHASWFPVLDNTREEGHVCPGDTSCCKTPRGKCNCCPRAFGVCCSDLTHCCPQGFTCDLSTLSCRRDPLYPFVRDVSMLPMFPSSSSQP
ncbi:unnamed protein product, partial [Ixodes persulcatus]